MYQCLYEMPIQKYYKNSENMLQKYIILPHIKEFASALMAILQQRNYSTLISYQNENVFTQNIFRKFISPELFIAQKELTQLIE